MVTLDRVAAVAVLQVHTRETAEVLDAEAVGAAEDVAEIEVVAKRDTLIISQLRNAPVSRLG